MKELSGKEVKSCKIIFGAGISAVKVGEAKCIAISLNLQDVSGIDPENLNLANLQDSLSPMCNQTYTDNYLVGLELSEGLLEDLEAAIQELKN